MSSRGRKPPEQVGSIQHSPGGATDGLGLRVTIEDAEEPVWQRISRLAEVIPGNFPPDLAARHDQRIHGRPKRGAPAVFAGLF